jgi:hypothetical protein
VNLYDRTNHRIITDHQLRAENPNISIPLLLTPDVLGFFNCVAVLPSPVPDAPEGMVAAIVGATKDTKGNWVEVWDVVDL